MVSYISKVFKKRKEGDWEMSHLYLLHSQHDFIGKAHLFNETGVHSVAQNLQSELEIVSPHLSGRMLVSELQGELFRSVVSSAFYKKELLELSLENRELASQLLGNVNLTEVTDENLMNALNQTVNFEGVFLGLVHSATAEIDFNADLFANQLTEALTSEEFEEKGVTKLPIAVSFSLSESNDYVTKNQAAIDYFKQKQLIQPILEKITEVDQKICFYVRRNDEIIVHD